MKTDTTEKGFDLDLLFYELDINGKSDKFCRWLILTKTGPYWTLGIPL